LLKNSLVFISIAVGVLFPFGHSYTHLIQYFLMVMLFWAFLEIDFSGNPFDRKQFYLVAANLVIPLFWYYTIMLFNNTLALIAFVAALAPTAIASATLVSILNKNIKFTTVYVMISNFAMSIGASFLLPLVVSKSIQISVIDVLLPSIQVVGYPLILALIIDKYIPKFANYMIHRKGDAYYLLIINLYLASSKASHFIVTEYTGPIYFIFIIGIAISIVAFINFAIGRKIGGSELKLECGQGLGQKNNSFTIWISLTFLSPLAALGPIFYLFFQNSYISYLLHKHRHEIGVRKK